MTKILILGGGFGGIRCALDLEKKSGNDVTVTLIDKNSYHLFLPALYEAASAFKGSLKNDPFALRLKKTICIPFYDIFKNKKVNFVQAEVCEVDLSAKKVKTNRPIIVAAGYKPGCSTDYDAVLLAKTYSAKELFNFSNKY